MISITEQNIKTLFEILSVLQGTYSFWNRKREGNIIISLQPILPSDSDFLMEVFKECRPDLAYITGISEEQKSDIVYQQFISEQYQLKQIYPEAELNLITINGKAVGRLYINHGKNEIRIIAIGLLESYRSIGIGKKIMNSILENALEKGKVVSLQVAWFNNSAYAFYEKLGFKVIEDNGVLYEMKYIPQFTGLL